MGCVDSSELSRRIRSCHHHADEGAIVALLRCPNLHTIANLWVTKRLDIRNGLLFDLAARRPKIRTKDLLRNINKHLALKTAASFLFVSGGGPWSLEHIHGDLALADGTESANKKNVHYHYDVSNAFYALFLDPEMVYACGYYRQWQNSLESAQHDKLDMICRKLRLNANETFLDIGCGWGALICHAARHYGVRSHGVTLAERQYAYAKAKIERLGLQGRVSVELCDYTRVDGQFDKIASIGMFEQVGLANHAAYSETINRLLKTRGLYLHHCIGLG